MEEITEEANPFGDIVMEDEEEIKASSSKNAQNLQFHGLGTQLNKNHAKVTILEPNPHTETRRTPTKG